MDDETKSPFDPKDPHHVESRIGGLSVRAIIVSLVVVTVCVMSVMAKEVKEPLYTLVGLTVGYYFGQNMKTPGK